MTINRFVLSGIVLTYLSVASVLGSADAAAMLGETAIYFAAYDLLSLALFLHILYRPGVSVTRRLLAIVLDLGLFSYGVAVGGESTAALYPIYLWVILGNGFRFGVKYLFAACFVAVVGFTYVIAVSDFWHQHLALSTGLLVGLVALPLYVSRLIAKLSETQRQAEAASRAKSLFIASVSHELRTPLNAIIGLGTLLGKTKLDADQGNMARTITTAGQSLLGLINSILDFSRVESGLGRVLVSEFDTYASLDNVRRMLAVQVGDKDVRLNLHITPRTPRYLKGDLHALEGPLINLVGNALKFTSQGFVTIAADAIERPNGTYTLRIEVSDTGIGITPEAQGRIFESFTQADETIVDRFGGTGLGLATSKQLVERAGGTIGVESKPGAGSTFWFEIDFALSDTDVVPARTVTPSYVLLSRDSSVTTQLSALGRKVSAAETMSEAINLLDALAASAASNPVVFLLDAGVLSGDRVEALAAAFPGRDSDKFAVVLIGTTDDDGLPSSRMRSLCVTRLSRPLDRFALSRALLIAESRFHASDPLAYDHVPDRGKPLSILVADDNRTNQMVLSKILSLADHEVVLVDDGEAALDALEEHAFDIVLMDVNMPVLNGIDATKLYRFSTLGQRSVPIVALTADASPDTRRRCEEAGMVACIAKPVEAEELLSTISAIVSAHEADNPVPVVRRAPPVRSEALLTMPDANGRSSAVDQRTLDRLEQLGDKEFVQEMAQLFADDAIKTIDDIAAAVADGNAIAFQDSVHALRSSAANIGAQEIFKMCLAWREASPRDLAVNGEEYLFLLRSEYDRVCDSLGVAPATPPSPFGKSAEWHHTRRQ
ncbi:ATP-binding protein [Microvirga antarctica]|uniref:ATP-binding protein n=1 Tax=Microvirga antarctica TaxID=2819233 RepID=UPI001B31214C|nr:ATP-binding protein [Microvirga antarctica]